MNILGVIPARYGSQRLEGKPLVDIWGKTMIQRVYEQAAKVLEHLVVATDDQRIYDNVKSFGGNVVMTASHHNTGTNRCLEAYEILQAKSDVTFDFVINVQGDEPLLEPGQIRSLIQCFNDPTTELATLVMPVHHEADLFNESEVFVVFDKNKKALYFSRSVIPHVRGIHKTQWLQHHTYFKHLGMYGFKVESLKKFAHLEQTKLELAESLEQNRWLENGGVIKIEISQHDTIPVDTIDDLEKVRRIVKQMENK
ncbi:MAG: 3-deoxy-manno-octulosonate cytidylyltransferase [Flavobacteriales bacterium]|nr:3-deoxy-manno-octulosonate cytidylyltransferase [Flavobacteriales bacterium]MCB9197452.1 3-deoxy-manno-octulosonate cytidylyltransferase [Flavobacteriales bacterium]